MLAESGLVKKQAEREAENKKGRRLRDVGPVLSVYPFAGLEER